MSSQASVYAYLGSNREAQLAAVVRSIETAGQRQRDLVKRIEVLQSSDQSLTATQSNGSFDYYPTRSPSANCCPPTSPAAVSSRSLPSSDAPQQLAHPAGHLLYTPITNISLTVLATATRSQHGDAPDASKWRMVQVCPQCRCPQTVADWVIFVLNIRIEQAPRRLGVSEQVHTRPVMDCADSSLWPQDLDAKCAAKRVEATTQEDLRQRCEELLAYRLSVDEERAAAARQDELHAAAAQVRPQGSGLGVDVGRQSSQRLGRHSNQSVDVGSGSGSMSSSLSPKGTLTFPLRRPPA